LDTKRREPWLFEDKYKNLMREAIRHRYALLPFWYTLFHEASKSGSPIVAYVFVYLFVLLLKAAQEQSLLLATLQYGGEGYNGHIIICSR
jgi:hypothetical protein